MIACEITNILLHIYVGFDTFSSDIVFINGPFVQGIAPHRDNFQSEYMHPDFRVSVILLR